MINLLPVYSLDFVSNLTLICISVYLVIAATLVSRKRREESPVWAYLQWQVFALAVFALSHSAGHIAKRLLIMAGRREMWETVAPYTGGINSLSFVVVGILAFMYKDIRTAISMYDSLRETKKELEQSVIMLKESSLQMERDSEEILNKNRELTALNRIAITPGKLLDIDRVMATVIGEVKTLLGAEFLGIYMLEGGRITLRAWDGLSEGFRDAASEWSIEEPWLKRYVMEGKPFFASEHTGEHGGRIEAEIKAEGVQAWAAIPLMAKGRVIGAMAVGSSRYEGIRPEQLNTLATIGGYAGAVIENARLYEELTSKVEDLEKFRKVAVGREIRIIELKDKLKEKGGT